MRDASIGCACQKMVVCILAKHSLVEAYTVSGAVMTALT